MGVMLQDLNSPYCTLSRPYNNLTTAVMVGDMDRVRSLLEQNVNPNNNLTTAVMVGDIDRVRSLLEQNVNPNTEMDQHGYTPLIQASKGSGNSDKKEIVELLFRYNADVNQTDKYGVTPLMCASGWDKNNIPIVKFLLQNGADITVENRHKENAFSRASHRGYIHLMRILLRHAKANVGADRLTAILSDRTLEYAVSKVFYLPKKDLVGMVSILGKGGAILKTKFKQKNVNIFTIIAEQYPDKAKKIIKAIKEDANDYCDTLIYEIMSSDLGCNVPKDIARLIAEFSTNYFPDYESREYAPERSDVILSESRPDLNENEDDRRKINNGVDPNNTIIDDNFFDCITQ